MFLILFCIHSILVFFILNIAIAFKVKKITIFILKESKLKFYLIYIISFFISALIFFRVIGTNGLQIVNFLFSFIILFELCIKIAESERFINWIGESLEKSLRYLIMFVISLNATYFFTRITEQVIKSQNI